LEVGVEVEGSIGGLSRSRILSVQRHYFTILSGRKREVERQGQLVGGSGSN
jgi:hypothetical protein